MYDVLAHVIITQYLLFDKIHFCLKPKEMYYLVPCFDLKVVYLAKKSKTQNSIKNRYKTSHNITVRSSFGLFQPQNNPLSADASWTF